MQARVGIGQVRPGKMHELVERLENAVYSAYRDQKGFSGAVFLTNADTGKVMSISMWETAADLNAGEENTAKQRAALAELFSAQRMRETYEVTIETGAPIPR